MTMATKTKPAWVEEIERQAAQPYTPDELARIRAWVETVERINAGKRWPPGTLQALLDKARAEDDERHEPW